MPKCSVFSYLYNERRGRGGRVGIKMIGNVGFPIVVTLYLLHRIESKLEGVIVAIEKLPRQLLKYEILGIKNKVCSS